MLRVCFQHYKDWVVHFIEADCRTTIGRQTRYFHFATEEGLRSFVSRCNVEDMADFEHVMRAWRAVATTPTSPTSSMRGSGDDSSAPR